MLISILFAYGRRPHHELRDHAPDPRLLPVSSRTASRKSAGAALRRCAAPLRSDQRAILSPRLSQPPEAAWHDGGGYTPRDGSDHVDGGSQAVAAPRAGPHHAGPGRSPRPSHDAHGKGAKGAGPRGSHLEKDPRCSRGASPRWRRGAASQKSTRALVNSGQQQPEPRQGHRGLRGRHVHLRGGH